MFDEDDIFCFPTFDEQIYYDDSMPPIYDDYCDESGFGEVMTLFSDESTILEEVPIDYENKFAIVLQTSALGGPTTSTRRRLCSRHQALSWRHCQGGECLKVYL